MNQSDHKTNMWATAKTGKRERAINDWFCFNSDWLRNRHQIDCSQSESVAVLRRQRFHEKLITKTLEISR